MVDNCLLLHIAMYFGVLYHIPYMQYAKCIELNVFVASHQTQKELSRECQNNLIASKKEELGRPLKHSMYFLPHSKQMPRFAIFLCLRYPLQCVRCRLESENMF